VSAIAAVPRCRFAFTRRQWRNQAKRLRARLEEQQAAARTNSEIDRQEIRGERRENEALRDRLSRADELIRRQEQQIPANNVDMGVLIQERDAARAMSRQLASDLTATRAALENQTAITVPPMHRDTDSLDQPTVPTPISVLPLHDAPLGVRP
jgi:hypothetical protein